jgi:hypothetical protein
MRPKSAGSTPGKQLMAFVSSAYMIGHGNLRLQSKEGCP